MAKLFAHPDNISENVGMRYVSKQQVMCRLSTHTGGPSEVMSR